MEREDSDYQASLNNLSYKQLLRISSAITATTKREQVAFRLFFRSLTPPELKVAKSIQNEPNLLIRKEKIRALKDKLLQKNKEEIAGVDINALIKNAKNSGDL